MKPPYKIDLKDDSYYARSQFFDIPNFKNHFEVFDARSKIVKPEIDIEAPIFGQHKYSKTQVVSPSKHDLGKGPHMQSS